MTTLPPPAKYELGAFVRYVGDDQTVYKVRVDKRQHKSLGNQWIYSGEGQPHISHEGQWLPKGKSRIILNMREKELTAWE